MKLDLNLVQRIAQGCAALLDRARENARKRLLAWCVVVVGLPAIWLLSVAWLQWQQREEGERWTSQHILKSRTSDLQFAQDSIGDCIKATGESPAQQKWYCDRAIAEYRKASEYVPPAYVDDVIQKRLFLAMHTALAHYLRSLELDHQRQARPWERVRDNQVRFVLSPWGFAIAGAIALIALGWVAARLWLPRRPALVTRLAPGGRSRRSSMRASRAPSLYPGARARRAPDADRRATAEQPSQALRAE